MNATIACWLVGLSTQAIAQTSLPERAIPASLPTSCLSGTPSGRYEGDRPITRNEAAAGLNACLQRLQQVLPNSNRYATPTDLESLLQQQRDLNQQLQQLGDRVEAIAGEAPTTPQSP